MANADNVEIKDLLSRWIFPQAPSTNFSVLRPNLINPNLVDVLFLQEVTRLLCGL